MFNTSQVGGADLAVVAGLVERPPHKDLVKGQRSSDRDRGRGGDHHPGKDGPVAQGLQGRDGVGDRVKLRGRDPVTLQEPIRQAESEEHNDRTAPDAVRGDHASVAHFQVQPVIGKRRYQQEDAVVDVIWDEVLAVLGHVGHLVMAVIVPDLRRRLFVHVDVIFVWRGVQWNRIAPIHVRNIGAAFHLFYQLRDQNLDRVEN